MKLVYLANAIITILVGTLIFVFKPISSTTLLLNILFLLIVLEMPTIYLLLARRKNLDNNDNELLAPSLILFIITFIVDIIFYSICIAVNSCNFKLFVLYTSIFHCIIIVLLLVVKAMTNYIRNQHK